ncbi:hypothetical protein, partial [Xanthomonas phaseoli]|uniref:hypothetical protein n=2 Tax=Xanthomonas TaxID=338 RepID=UPI001F3CF181
MPAVDTGPHAQGPEPTAPSGRPHKRVHWRQPKPLAGKKRRPGVLDATRHGLVRALEERKGAWKRIRHNVIVAGYALDKALTRVRGLRKDGADSLLAMAVALLYLADVRTGFVGKPRQGGGPWQRYTLPDLAQLAYGGQSDAEQRRARRSLDMMVSLGWAFPTKQVRRHTKDADGGDLWCSEAGVRRLNFQRLCDMVGTSRLGVEPQTAEISVTPGPDRRAARPGQPLVESTVSGKSTANRCRRRYATPTALRALSSCGGCAPLVLPARLWRYGCNFDPAERGASAPLPPALPSMPR